MKIFIEWPVVPRGITIEVHGGPAEIASSMEYIQGVIKQLWKNR